MSLFGGIFKALGSVVTAPLNALSNIARGKFSLTDILTVASLAAPGGSLLNLGSKGLGSLTMANVGRNLGTAGLLNSAGLNPKTAEKAVTGKGNIMDYMKTVQGLSTIAGAAAGSVGSPAAIPMYTALGNAQTPAAPPGQGAQSTTPASASAMYDFGSQGIFRDPIDAGMHGQAPMQTEVISGRRPITPTIPSGFNPYTGGVSPAGAFPWGFDPAQFAQIQQRYPHA